MILALSTSFANIRRADAPSLIQRLEQIDVRAVELDYRLEPKVFHSLRPMLKQAGIAVVSLHNYCPFPQLVPKVPPGGDYFRLSALQREERGLAVAWTLKTLELAHDLEAWAVVLHCGGVRMEPRRGDLYRMFTAQGAHSQSFQTLLSLVLEQRAARLGPHMDALRFSLDKLLPSAERLQVTLGLENRYHFDELPGYDEMALLMAEFAGGPMGYWHDSGHAHAQACLGLASQAQWLERYERHLVGAHLHDARGLEDHLPPGCGEIDLAAVLAILGRTRPAVLELSQGISLDDLKKAVVHMRSLATQAFQGAQAGSEKPDHAGQSAAPGSLEKQ